MSASAAAWSAGDVQANGIKIHYYRTGGDKPPLVLAHGFSDNGLCWTRVSLVLAKDFDLIMPDARGHGFSDAPEEGNGDLERGADLAGLIEALDLDKPALMGHSMGAATVAATAVGYPELVGCAVLEDPPWFSEDSPRYAERANATPQEQRARVENMLREIVDRRSQSREEIMAFGRERSPTWDEIEFGPWADAKRQLSPNVVRGFGAPRPDWRDTAARLRCPTLLVTADPELGAIVTPATAQQAAEINPNIEVAHLPGAGHNIRREQFERFVQVTTAFLSRVY